MTKFTENNYEKNELNELVCFTIMPSGSREEYQGGQDESNYVYRQIIQKGINKASEQLNRDIRAEIEFDRNRPGSITKSIIKSLASADYVIADLTGGNPNVFLELGIRYSLCPTNTVLLRQKHESLPFDIANYKAISYERFKPDIAADSIAEFLVNAQTDCAIDSPVFEYIDNLSVTGQEINSNLLINSEGTTIMNWTEIMQRIDRLGFYNEHFTSGTFTPAAIIGISNGGMIMAEIISRKFFHHMPVICLWADRWSPDRLDDSSWHYFKNPYAKAAISPLKELAIQDKPLTLLVIDDNVASGTTCNYVVRFLREELGEDTKILFQPVVCKETALTYLTTVEGVLAPSFGSGLFKLNKKDFLNKLSTTKNRFPYDKDIRG